MPSVPKEVTAEHYQLKATFFSNQLEACGYVGLFEEVQRNLATISSTLNWSTASTFGVKEAVMQSIQASGLSLPVYLCHPNILISNPRYLIYYRCISSFSQKGLKVVSGVSSVDRLEAEGRTCTAAQANKLAKAINENLSATYVISVPEAEKLKGLLYATAGTTLDGSWRNAIGAEGERLIRTLFLKELLKNGELSKVTNKSGEEFLASSMTEKWLDENTPKLSSGMTVNGAVIVFGSEPDIKLIDPTSKVAGGVEIKAGIDPAGALERLGAAMKSFENLRSESSSAETILVATCITDEVDTRLRSMSGVRTFIMTDVIQNNKNAGNRLINIMRASIGLTKRYL